MRQQNTENEGREELRWEEIRFLRSLLHAGQIDEVVVRLKKLDLQNCRDEELVLQFVSLVPSDEDTLRFLNLFSGMEGIYARQWYNPQKGTTGYSPVNEPLSPRIPRHHFWGDITVGVYCLKSDSTVRFFGIDIDLTRKDRRTNSLLVAGR